jgi:sarcosine oxidase subunit alpha
VIGLAYVAPEQSAVGTRFPIKVGPSRFVDAEVVPLPFYDPEGHRQEVA